MNASDGKVDTGVIVGVLIAVAVAVAIGSLLLVDTTGEKGSGLSDAYDLDAVKLAKFDPNLLCYEETGTPIPTGFARSRGLALGADGRFYIAGDEAIRVLSQTGNLHRVISLSREPRCVAVAPDGKLYVGVRDHVEVYDGAGQRLASWEKLGLRAFLTSIVVARDEILVADAGNAVVLRFDATGALMGRIGEKNADRNIPGFHVPSPYFDLAVAPDGLLRAVSPGRLRIEAYTLNGDLAFWWGEGSIRIEGFCGCCNPVNFAMLPDGSYVTAEKGLIRVKVYDPEGAFVGVVAGPEQLVEGGASRVFENVDDAQASGFDVAVDAAGRVYILDTIENAIRVFVKNEKGGPQ
jgi:hypothetical protein